MTVPSAHPWHCDESALAAFVDGTVDPVSGASVETHLMTCADCRADVARLSTNELLEEVWTRVRDEVERPVPGVAERLLCRCGVSEETARLLAAVPALRGAWLLGVVGATVFAVLANEISQLVGTAAFLVIAPMAPLVGVSVSFGGDADPTSELVLTSPYSTLRLLLLRTCGVVASAVPVAILVGLALPGPSWLAVAWLTPAAALVSVALALGPYIGHTPAAAVVGATWTLTVATAVRMGSLTELVEPAIQITCLLLAVVGAASVAVHYRSLGHTWRNT